MKVTFKQKGNFNKTEKFFKDAKNVDYRSILKRHAEEGIQALSSATPRDTGKTANSWYYEIIENSKGISIIFKNSNVIDDWFNVAIGLQYGHGTIYGGWVEGIDYINPALKPIFDKITEAIWSEVTIGVG